MITSREELDAAFALAGEDSLVLLTVLNGDQCNLGAGDLTVPSAFGGREDEACVALKESTSRVARESPSVTFLSLDIGLDAGLRSLTTELGVSLFPTLQYYKAGKLLWQHAGAAGADGSIAEALLFHNAQENIAEISKPDDLADFLASCAMPQEAVRGITLDVPCDNQLGVLDVSTERDSPSCLHIYPAVVALSKNTAGAVRWARLVGDKGPGQAQLMAQLKVSSVPTFIFFSKDKEVGRYTGADRGALMAAVLEVQSATGYQLPQAPVRKRPSVAEAKKIAQAAREREKAAGRKSGW